jgi:excisionase family DNA binding protein
MGQLYIGFYRVPPSVAQLASLLGISEEKVLEAQHVASPYAVESLEALAYEDASVEERHDFVSLFQGAVEAEGARQTELKALFEQVFEHALTECERRIFQARYGVGGYGCAKTLRTTAEVLGMPLATVETLHGRAAGRLRGLLEPLVCSEQGIEAVRAQFGDYYNVNEAASCLGVSCQTIRDYIAQGRLPAQQGVSRSGGSARRWMLPKEAVEALRVARSQDGEKVAV